MKKITKIYTAPTIEIIVLEANDVMTLSNVFNPSTDDDGKGFWNDEW